MLGILHVGVVLAFGLIKLFANVYRGWIAESATRALRGAIDDRLAALPGAFHVGDIDAVGASMILAECDDVGGFVGSSISEPVLQGGFLMTLFVYPGLLQPWMALVALIALAPRIVFVPALQGAISQRISRRITLKRRVGFDIVSASGTPRCHALRDERLRR
jgi:ABC-type multidrug transport system fused ATPase/permease subunit